MQSLSIQQILFVESGTYNNMAYRPYQANVNPADVMALQEAIHGRPNLSPVGLAGVAGRIIQPSATPLAPVNIANGWNQRRFLFLMEVDIPSAFGADLKQIVCGYTDHLGQSLQGSLDPNMELYINSVTTLRASMEDRGWGPQIYYVPTDNAQILIGDYNPSFHTLNAMPTAMRPMDVFDTVGMSMAPPDAMRIDQRTTFSEGPRKSRRTNNTAPHYLARVLNGAANAFANDDTSEMAMTMSYASDSVQEGLLSDDNFIGHFLARGAFTPHNTILYSTLLHFDPTLDAGSTTDRVHVIKRGSGQQIGSVAHEAGMTEHWNGNLQETVMANILAQAVPALMTENMITKANITFTNRTPDGQFAVTVDDRPGDEGINGFIRGMDLTTYVQRFFFQLINTVLRDLSRNNLIDMAVSMRVRLTSETWIRIAVGQNPPIDYVYPTFSDALLTPCMSPTQQPLAQMAGNMGMLFNTVCAIPSPGGSTAMAGSASAPAPSGIITSYGGNNYGSSGTL